jgi:hypothetical protein
LSTPAFGFPHRPSPPLAVCRVNTANGPSAWQICRVRRPSAVLGPSPGPARPTPGRNRHARVPRRGAASADRGECHRTPRAREPRRAGSNGLCMQLWRNARCLWMTMADLWATRRYGEFAEESCRRGVVRCPRTEYKSRTPSLRGRRDRTETEDPIGEAQASSRQSVTRLSGSDGPTGRAGVTLKRSTVGLLKLIL